MVYVCAPWEKKTAATMPITRPVIVTWFGVTGVFMRSPEINPDILRIIYLSIIGLSDEVPMIVLPFFRLLLAFF